MTKNDIYVLSSIKKIGATNSLKSVPVSTIMKNIKISHSTVRISIKTLIENELVQEGYMQKNAKTYFITESGIDLINNLYKDLKNEEE